MARTRKKPAPAPAGEGAEVTDAPVQVVTRAAAIDVAKGSGMVCTRLPSDTRAGRRTQRVWQVTATFDAVVTLMDHLRSQGIERLVLESTSDYWRIWFYVLESVGLAVQLVSASQAICSSSVLRRSMPHSFSLHNHAQSSRSLLERPGRCLTSRALTSHTSRPAASAR